MFELALDMKGRPWHRECLAAWRQTGSGAPEDAPDRPMPSDLEG